MVADRSLHGSLHGLKSLVGGTHINGTTVDACEAYDQCQSENHRKSGYWFPLRHVRAQVFEAFKNQPKHTHASTDLEVPQGWESMAAADSEPSSLRPSCHSSFFCREIEREQSGQASQDLDIFLPDRLHGEE